MARHDKHTGESFVTELSQYGAGIEGGQNLEASTEEHDAHPETESGAECHRSNSEKAIIGTIATVLERLGEEQQASGSVR